MKATIQQRRRLAVEEPTPEHREMLELLKELNGAEVARRFGVTRQRVWQVAKRWKHWRVDWTERSESSEGLSGAVRRSRDGGWIVCSRRLTRGQADCIHALLRSWGYEVTA